MEGRGIQGLKMICSLGSTLTLTGGVQAVGVEGGVHSLATPPDLWNLLVRAPPRPRPQPLTGRF